MEWKEHNNKNVQIGIHLWSIEATGLSLLLNYLLRKIAVMLTVKRANWFRRETINIVNFAH